MALRQLLALEETEPVLRNANGHARPRLLSIRGRTGRRSTQLLACDEARSNLRQHRLCGWFECMRVTIAT